MPNPSPSSQQLAIDPQRVTSLGYWSARLGRPPEEVEAAVAVVGTRPADVAAYLRAQGPSRANVSPAS